MTEQTPDRPGSDDGRDRRSASGGRGDPGRQGRGSAAESWERRASELASEVQRWLIRTSARNMRDELGGQVRKALRGEQREEGDVWSTATTEPAGAANEAPECAWCPVCRAARRIRESRAAESEGAGSVLSDAADVVAGAVRDALGSIDSILSYRPGDFSAASPGRDQAAGSNADDSQPGDSNGGGSQPGGSNGGGSQPGGSNPADPSAGDGGTGNAAAGSAARRDEQAGSGTGASADEPDHRS